MQLLQMAPGDNPWPDYRPPPEPTIELVVMGRVELPTSAYMRATGLFQVIDS
jgi:hypothetical protein